jgi:hypothetical protein
MATPVEVSLCVRAYRSTPASATGSGWRARSVVITDGSSRNGAALAAAANFELNSPKDRCWLFEEIRPKVAMSQNSVAPPLPSTTS